MFLLFRVKRGFSMALVSVAKESEIQQGQGKVVNAGGKTIALFRTENGFFAIENACKHRGGPLGEGELDGCTVTCPLHGWQYDVKTGECQTTPGQQVQVYKVVVEGGEVKVEV